MMSDRKSQCRSKKEGFVRKTVTLPEDIAPFAEQQASKPEHAGNMSSYIRALILRDREKQLAA